MQKFLTLEEAGQALGGRSVKAMRSLCARGAIPYSKVAGRRMIEAEEFEKFLTLGRVRSAKEASARTGGHEGSHSSREP